jgi:hypothetical protein
MQEEYGRAPDLVYICNLRFDLRKARQTIRDESDTPQEANLAIEDLSELEVARFGSEQLLAALWREHPERMEFSRSKGLLVLDPPVDHRIKA